LYTNIQSFPGQCWSAAALKPIYRAPSIAAAKLEAFDQSVWGHKYPAIALAAQLGGTGYCGRCE
jgi:hypothetical protein